MSHAINNSPTKIQNIQVTITERKSLLTTPNPFEQKFGYHRAVRRGPFIAVSGTTALKVHTSKLPTEVESGTGRETGTGIETESGNISTVHHPGDAFKQALLSLGRAIEAVTRLGGQTEDIIHVRMFVARSEDCEAVGAAFQRHFGVHNGEKGVVTDTEVRLDVVGAAATMIVVPGGFVDGAMLVEVEVDAYVL